MNKPQHWLRRLRRSALGRLARVLTPIAAKRHRGLALETFIPLDGDHAEAVRCLDAAISLIQQHSPWILAHAVRSKVRIEVTRKGRIGFEYGDIEVGSDWLQATSPPYVAAALVHQLALARIRKRIPLGIHTMRVTRLLFEIEVAFCARLPDGAAIVARLTQAWDGGYYDLDHARREWVQAGEDRLASLALSGAPSFVQRLMRRLYFGRR